MLLGTSSFFLVHDVSSTRAERYDDVGDVTLFSALDVVEIKSLVITFLAENQYIVLVLSPGKGRHFFIKSPGHVLCCHHVRTFAGSARHLGIWLIFLENLV